ncbi:MAG TPA: MlaD family protein [Bacteroidales bacterium]|nr:MlaD family protein [Bacteroidales bacterium]
MQKDTTRKVKLGIFVSIILLAFFFAIYYVGKNRNLFHEVTKVYTVFPDIKGLGRGSNVRFSGINVGTVSGISIQNDTTVKVEISIQSDYDNFIKEDSKVEITNDGLMGNKILIIHHGSAGSPPVKEFTTLKSVKTINVEDIVNEATKIIKNARDATSIFLEVSNHLKSGHGDLGKLIYDTTLTHNLNNTMRNLMITSGNTKDITNHIRKGEGDLGSLVYSDTLTNNLKKAFDQLIVASENIRNISRSLDTAAVNINEGSGILHTLIYDSTFIQHADSTLTNMNQGIDEITKTFEAIKNSWIINLFGEKQKKQDRKQEENKEAGKK